MEHDDLKKILDRFGINAIYTFFLKNGIVYSGVIEQCLDSGLILIVDKNGNPIIVSLSTISHIQKFRGGKK